MALNNVQKKINSFLNPKRKEKIFLDNLILKNLQFDKLKTIEKNYFKDLLQIFFYNDLDVLKLKPLQTKKLYLKIFHYLYNKKFDNGKPFDKKIKKNLIKIDNTFVENIRENRRILEELYKYYIKKVLEIKLKTIEDTLSKVLIFEAPPFCNGKNVTSHFLFEGGNYYSAIVKDTRLNIKTITEADIDDFKKNNPILTDSKNKWYIKSKKNVISNSKIIKTLCRINEVIDSDILFLDLFLIPMDIDFEVRNAWATETVFKFNEKSLPVLLLDWALEYLKVSCGRKDKQLFSKNCLIAIGAPRNTSIGIFEHYASAHFPLENVKGKPLNYTDISSLNSPTAFLKMGINGITFPMFKANVVRGNNMPDYTLVRNAFNIRL